MEQAGAAEQRQGDEHARQRTDQAKAKVDEVAKRLKAAWKLYDAMPLDPKQKTHPGVEQVIKDLLFEHAVHQRRARHETDK